MCVICIWQKITIFSKGIIYGVVVFLAKTEPSIVYNKMHGQATWAIIKMCHVESTLWTLQAELNRQ